MDSTAKHSVNKKALLTLGLGTWLALHPNSVCAKNKMPTPTETKATNVLVPQQHQ
jgi:hypothetical protein